MLDGTLITVAVLGGSDYGYMLDFMQIFILSGIPGQVVHFLSPSSIHIRRQSAIPA